jgi:hypothetical protein
VVARKRPTASDVKQHSELVCLQGGRPDADQPRLTRAEANDLRHSAALTYARLAEHLSFLTGRRRQGVVADDGGHDAASARSSKTTRQGTPAA